MLNVVNCPKRKIKVLARKTRYTVLIVQCTDMMGYDDTVIIITVPCIILLVVVVELFVSHDLYTFQDKPAEQVTNSNKSPPVAGKCPCNQDYY